MWAFLDRAFLDCAFLDQAFLVQCNFDQTLWTSSLCFDKSLCLTQTETIYKDKRQTKLLPSSSVGTKVGPTGKVVGFSLIWRAILG